MRADFSRVTFDARKHYVGVLHQQGRVWLDAEGNEDVQSRLHLLRQETADMIGACGAPDPGTAFAITAPGANSAPDDFLIAGGEGPLGHYYVDGILCQLEQTNASYLNQPDLPNPPRIPTTGVPRAVVYLEVWRRLITYLEDPSLREIALGGPDTTTRLKTVAQVKVAPVSSTDLTCATASTFLPGQGKGTLTTLQPQVAQPTDLCRLPDPANYTGRDNHLYRLEIHDGGDVLGATPSFASRVKLGANADQGATKLTLATPLASPEQMNAWKRSGLVTIVDDDGNTATVALADVPDTKTLSLGQALGMPFTTAKNATVTGGVAQFKWSRDNAAFAVAVTAVSNDRLTLTLSSLGRDQATALRQGDLVEISDDASELGPGRGHLTTLNADPDPDQFTVNLADKLPDGFGTTADAATRHLLLRRWDGLGLASGTFDERGTPDMNLGDGVHIQFGGSDLSVGDYWQFAARSADGSVEALTNAPPKGIIRHYCPLAIVGWSAETPPKFSLVADCRKKFPPLTRLTHLYYVSGDGQETLPGQELPQPLQVGVANGPWAVSGAQVRFQIIKPGTGTGVLIQPPHVQSGADIIVPTGPDGVASCNWQLDTSTPSQQVEATLVSGAALPVRFNAAFRDTGGQEPGVQIIGVQTFPDGTSLRNDSDVLIARLVGNTGQIAGIDVICKQSIESTSISPATCYITVNVALPPQATTPAYQPLILAGDVGVTDNKITWRRRLPTVDWLNQQLATLPTNNQGVKDRGILARLTLKGNFIWASGATSQKPPELYLDGDSFADPTDPTGLRMPIGDGRRGGDFDMWFWLVARTASTAPSAAARVININPASKAAFNDYNNLPPKEIVVGFDKRLLAQTVNTTTVQVSVSKNGGVPQAVPGTVVYDDASKSARFTPSQPFEAGVQTPNVYAVVVRGDPPNPILDIDNLALDGDGNGAPGGNFTSSFTITHIIP